MKKSLKIILITILAITSIIVIDTVQARLFKNSPVISLKEELDDNWVDKGILMDTYYCIKEKDLVEVSWHLKTSKFTCPLENNKTYDITLETNTSKDYIFSVQYNCDGGNAYLKENQNISYKCIDEIYVYDKEKKTKETLYYYFTYEYESIDDAIKPIIDELEQVGIYKDGGSIMYKNNNIAILKCNTVSGNRDIYIGKSNLRYEKDYCKDNQH